MGESIFKKNDIVICKGTRGYNFTTDKEYKVLDYEAECPATSAMRFTWPPYVKLQDDTGKVVCCHARRFKLKGE